MLFVYPLFLWALTAISIPIIIHLFNFRRYKKVYFTNVRFLKELQLESQSKSRLKELLILLSRILAIIFLVFAFAQPVLVDKQNTTINLIQKNVGIYIDNSFSMEGVNKQGQLFENAKKIAKEIISSYKTNDKFHLITNDFEGKHQRLYSKEDVLTEINDLKISPSVKRYTEVFKRQKGFLTGESNYSTFFYAITDAQKSSFNLPDLKNDSIHQLTIIPIAANETNNVYIDSCWFESPLQQKGFTQKLNVVIQNKSQKRIDAGTVRLTLNGNQAAIGSFSVESNSKINLSVSFTVKNEGFNYATLKIDDYPITFDDEFFFTFNSKITINTILIGGKETSTIPFFTSLFATDSLFNYTQLSENAINYSTFKSADLIILCELENISNGLQAELIKFTEKGGNLVIIPSFKTDINNYNGFYNAFNLPQITALDTHALKINKPDKNDPFFEGVFEKLDMQLNLPLSLQHFVTAKTSKQTQQTIYSLQNTDAFLSRSTFQNAGVFVFNSSLNEKQSNFCKHALFVPTFIRIAVTSVKPQPLFYTLNNNNTIALKSEGAYTDSPPHIIGVKNKIDIIPQIRLVNGNLNLFINTELNESGFYNVAWQDAIKQNMAFNYDRIESNLFFYTLDELKEIISKNNLKNYSLIDSNTNADVTSAIHLGANGIKLWKWCLLLTLVFLTIEICLIRFLK